MNIEPTFLVSFPRSGNTWTRYLLECATGIFSGSVYDDKDTFNLGYKGELEPYQSGRTLVIKTHTHAFKNSPPVKLDGPTYVILLIRNPADALISYWSFKIARDSKEKDFYHYNIDSKTYKGLNLKENPLQELRRMLDFLEVKEDEKRISCLKKHMKGPAKRDHKELKIEAFTKSEKRLIAHSLANTLNLLRNRGIKPPKSYSKLILPENMAINLNNSFV
ncbi:WSC domain-containing protein 2 [Armadillidium nasatum]|uniref:WSC domain-containing protein 2 n=1 Tax=Armadillidium nasatum TaxID=96803 RepID=A0A5N5SUP3_9CRUS|nr:WSC domain-containing protein 2 [Armadillidium nasatum]